MKKWVFILGFITVVLQGYSQTSPKDSFLQMDKTLLALVNQINSPKTEVNIKNIDSLHREITKFSLDFDAMSARFGVKKSRKSKKIKTNINAILGCADRVLYQSEFGENVYLNNEYTDDIKETAEKAYNIVHENILIITAKLSN